jgi:hypothetical protein
MITDKYPHAIAERMKLKRWPKCYRMGIIDGFAMIEVESSFPIGVVVYYIPTGIVYSWRWDYRDEAWAYAKELRQRVDKMREDKLAAKNIYQKSKLLEANQPV